MDLGHNKNWQRGEFKFVTFRPLQCLRFFLILWQLYCFQQDWLIWLRIKLQNCKIGWIGLVAWSFGSFGKHPAQKHKIVIDIFSTCKLENDNTIPPVIIHCNLYLFQAKITVPKKCKRQLKFLSFVIRGRGSMYILCTCSSTLVLAPKFWCWFDLGWVQTNSSHHNLHNPGNVTDFGVLSWTLFQTKENTPPIFLEKNGDFVQTGWTLP